MSELQRQDIDRLLQAIRKIPPKVIGTPIDRNESVVEMAKENYFVNFDSNDFRLIAVELYDLLEDLEKAEALTKDDDLALRSLVKELTSKRFIYLSEEKANELRRLGRTNE